MVANKLYRTIKLRRMVIVYNRTIVTQCYRVEKRLQNSTNSKMPDSIKTEKFLHPSRICIKMKTRNLIPKVTNSKKHYRWFKKWMENQITNWFCFTKKVSLGMVLIFSKWQVYQQEKLLKSVWKKFTTLC